MTLMVTFIRIEGQATYRPRSYLGNPGQFIRAHACLFLDCRKRVVAEIYLMHISVECILKGQQNMT